MIKDRSQMDKNIKGKKIDHKIKNIIVLALVGFLLICISYTLICYKNNNKLPEREEIFYEDEVIPQHYMKVYYNNIAYTLRDVALIDEKNIEKIAYAKAYFEDYGSGMEKNAAMDVFSISNISSDCAIALKIEGSNNYNIYLNNSYVPETLGEFILDLDLRETIVIGHLYYNYHNEDDNIIIYYYDDLPDDIIWEKLLSYVSAESVKDYDSRLFIETMSISIDIPLLGYVNIGIVITEDGYLVTNILDTGKAFYIGEEVTKAFVDYIVMNYDNKIWKGAEGKHQE